MNNPTNKTTVKGFVGTGCFDRINLIDYGLQNTKGLHYIFLVFNNFSDCSWLASLKNSWRCDRRFNTITE